LLRSTLELLSGRGPLYSGPRNAPFGDNTYSSLSISQATNSVRNSTSVQLLQNQRYFTEFFRHVQKTMDPNSTSAKLIQLGVLVQSALATLITSSQDDKQSLPPKVLFDAQRMILSAAGMLTELGSTPSNRLLEVSTQYFEARALHIAAEKRIPDMLAGFDDSGVAVEKLAEQVGCDAAKLCQYYRGICR
jgi:hypothetical protein